MTGVLDLADLDREHTTSLTASAFRRSLTQWNRVDPHNIATSWQALLPAAAAAVAAGQFQAAVSAEAFALTALDLQDVDVDGHLPDPTAFAGTMPATGATVDAALAGVAYHTLDRIAAGTTAIDALASGRFEIAALVQKAIAGTASAMSSVTATSRRQEVGYVRMSKPGCCPRCSVLTGRFYRWNKGFDRHAHCRCEHVPTSKSAADGLMTDPYELFEALTPAEQDRIWTKAGAQAIRDGGDIYQVGNSIQKRSSDGTRRSRSRRFTREGTGRGGYFRTGTQKGRAGGRRLTVDEVYRRAGGNRGKAIDLLRENGYITEVGQVAGGAIRGDMEGYGQFGRGGRRAGASEAVRRARATGVRDPRERATMTAQELRDFFARQAA